jgi:hypothetical protein
MMVWLVQQWTVALRERGKKWRRERERLMRWKAGWAAVSESALKPWLRGEAPAGRRGERA